MWLLKKEGQRSLMSKESLEGNITSLLTQDSFQRHNNAKSKTANKATVANNNISLLYLQLS